MSKRFKIAAAALLLCGALASLIIYWHGSSEVRSAAVSGKEMDEFAARQGIVLPPSAPAVLPAAPPLDPKKPVRLAIGWLGLSDAGQNQTVGDLMLAELAPASNLQLVDRQSLDQALREVEMGLSGVVRAQSAVRVGKLLRADWFLLGTAVRVNNSNYVVVRIVDARTGVMRDSGVFAHEKGPRPLAMELAAFVRQSREAASRLGKPREYLAIGGFEDLSLNNRQAAFPDKLRGYLMAAFQGNPNVTLLEREFVDTLLQEVRLDLAGLTEEGGVNAASRMQSAFWLVSGYYQSYETDGSEVDFVLRINRMFGHATADNFRGAPDEPFFGKIKSKIDATLAGGDAQLLAPTRRSEIRVQLDLGRQYSEDLVNRPGDVRGAQAMFNWADGRERARRRRSLEEAIRAFQTVLILDPENHQAKLGLAACLQHDLIGKEAEARALVREVTDSPVQDRFTAQAMSAMGKFCRYEDAAQSAEWFRRAVEVANRFGVPSTVAGEYVYFADLMKAEVQASTNLATQNPEAPLIEETRAMQARFRQKKVYQNYGEGFALESFVKKFGDDRIGAAQKLNAVLPGLLEQFPDLAPDLLAISLTYQTDTNNATVAEFVKSLEKSAAHPHELLVEDIYFWRLGNSCYNWCMDRKMYALAARIAELKCLVLLRKAGIKAGSSGEAGVLAAGLQLRGDDVIDTEDRLRLVYAYMALERWREALDVLVRLPNRPIPASWEGPWRGMVIPAELVAGCQEKLGLPVVRDPRVFKLGEPLGAFQVPVVLTIDGDDCWLAKSYTLWKMDWDRNIYTEIKLPKTPDTRISSLSASPAKLWIGTWGAGLIEYDKQTHECKLVTRNEGVTSISSIFQDGENLWLGLGEAYYPHHAGGFGRFDTRSGTTTLFTPALRPAALLNNDSDARYLNLTEQPDEPPRHSVSVVLSGGPGKVLLDVGMRGLCEYRITENRWNNLPVRPVCLAADARRLAFGFTESPTSDPAMKGIGVMVQTFADGRLEKLREDAGFPNTQISAVALDGDDLWVGGAGFIGVVDLNTKTLRKFCYTKSQEVTNILIGGGYVWIMMANHLYRIPVALAK